MPAALPLATPRGLSRSASALSRAKRGRLAQLRSCEFLRFATVYCACKCAHCSCSLCINRVIPPYAYGRIARMAEFWRTLLPLITLNSCCSIGGLAGLIHFTSANAVDDFQDRERKPEGPCRRWTRAVVVVVAALLLAVFFTVYAINIPHTQSSRVYLTGDDGNSQVWHSLPLHCIN